MLYAVQSVTLLYIYATIITKLKSVIGDSIWIFEMRNTISRGTPGSAWASLSLILPRPTSIPVETSLPPGRKVGVKVKESE